MSCYLFYHFSQRAKQWNSLSCLFTSIHFNKLSGMLFYSCLNSCSLIKNKLSISVLMQHIYRTILLYLCNEYTLVFFWIFYWYTSLYNFWNIFETKDAIRQTIHCSKIMVYRAKKQVSQTRTPNFTIVPLLFLVFIKDSSNWELILLLAR